MGSPAGTTKKRIAPGRYLMHQIFLAQLSRSIGGPSGKNRAHRKVCKQQQNWAATGFFRNASPLWTLQQGKTVLLSPSDRMYLTLSYLV